MHQPIYIYIYMLAVRIGNGFRVHCTIATVRTVMDLYLARDRRHVTNHHLRGADLLVYAPVCLFCWVAVKETEIATKHGNTLHNMLPYYNDLIEASSQYDFSVCG